ncbi:type VII secretion integral membrane protein EccD [Mycolicibacterium celeriflavum]|uniref:type VII secretion integral membrane protein EccD n=1 Tax=Mycolicibacterium celeriflavum TaxID=1249101 RepID=UPI003CF4B9FE
MPDSLCRVTVHVEGPHETRAVDLTLPRRACVGDMLPSIVDLIQPGPGVRWRLRRIGGSSLDDSLTLPDNAVRDGELLWLSADNVADPVFVDRDVGNTVARMGPAHGDTPRMVCVGGSVVAGGVGAGAILWSAGSTGRVVPALVGAALTAAAIIAATVARRMGSEALPCTTFGAMAAISAAVTGAVVVPPGPITAHLLLASAAALAAGVVTMRLTGRGLVPLAAIATGSLLCTAASAVSVWWALDGVAAGALLATIALAALGWAPRLAIALTRIGSEPLQQHHAARSHDLLTGMIAGASAAAAVAAVLVAYGAAGTIPAAAFNGVVGTALLLRIRTHIGAARRCALAVCGFIAISAGFVGLVAALPQHAHWLGALAAVMGTACLLPLFDYTPGVAARRAAELAEYAALAAIIPLGCWIAGIFGLVRGLALT